MKILFFENSPVWNILLPEGFKEAGCDVKVSGHVEEMDIPIILEEYKPDLVITMGWGQFEWDNYQEWISNAVKKVGIPHVYWSLEDPEHTYIFTLPLLKRVRPEFVFTISEPSASYFRKLGYKAGYLDYGYNPNIHYPSENRQIKKYQVSVVANAYAHILVNNKSAYRLQCLRILLYPLIKQGYQVDFWGSDWDKMDEILNINIPKEAIHGYLNYSETNRIFNESRIMLGFQNNYTQLTQRTYEILGSGSFLLTADTLAIRKKFNPEKNLIVSSSPNETIRLVDYYLNNPAEMNRISINGHEKVKDQTYRHRAIQMLNILTDHGIIS